MNELVLAQKPGLPEATAAFSARSLSQSQKAAIVLSVLDPADAANMLKGLDESSVLKFARAVSDLKPMPPHVLNEVVHEFLAHLSNLTDVRGGVDQVRSLLAGVMDDVEIDRIVAEITGNIKRPIWDRFGDAPANLAAAYLQLQHPQTVSYVLAKLKPSKAAAILEEIEREVANTSVIRLARIPTLDDDVQSILHATLDSDFLSTLSRKTNNILPEEVIGNLMNNVSTEAREEFLKFLADTNEELANNVIKVMFTFADIATRVRPNEVTFFTKEVEDDELLIALKHAQESGNPTFEFVISNMSKRLAERLNEELEAMEPPVAKEAEALQIKIVNIIQRKAKMGEMSLIEIAE